MATEEAPLLRNERDLIYERFSPREKRFLVAIASWSGLAGFFVGGCFVPSIPQIAKDLSSTGEIISSAVSMSIFASPIGALIGSTYAKFYGRRPAYMSCLPVLIIGCLGVARAQSVPELMVWRFIQSVGASPGLSVGAGMIADIYKLEERGVAMGSFLGAGLLGLAIAPTVGGVTAHYWSWRAIHYILAAFGFGALACIVTWLPETSHPGSRGIDEYKKAGKVHPSWRPFLLNPFAQLWLLRSPNIIAVSLVTYLSLMTDYTLLLPLAYTIGKRYGIDNEAIIGLCFLPLGMGNALGAPFSGWIADRTVVKWKQKRGKWFPEDRLRAALPAIYLPFTVLLSAIITKYVPGKLGLILNFVCMFFNGVGVDIALTPCGAYAVDILHSRSAEVTASSNALRNWFLAVTTAGILPMINTYGQLTTNLIVALLSLCGFGVLAFTIAYGEKMRGWVDVGYSTADSN